MTLMDIMQKGGRMNLKPLFDRVVIEPKVEENVVNGIVLPETSQERPQTGIVVAVGDGESFDSDKAIMKLSVGDRVLYNRYAGTELKLDGKNYVVMRQIDVIGVFE